MPDTSKTIQRFVRDHRPPDGQGYAPAVRARVVRYVRRRRADGLTWAALVPEVGLSTTTLSNWLRDSNDDDTPAFLLVHLAPPPPVVAPLSLTSPNGWCIDGLDLHDIAQLIPVLP